MWDISMDYLIVFNGLGQVNLIIRVLAHTLSNVDILNFTILLQHHDFISKAHILQIISQDKRTMSL